MDDSHDSTNGPDPSGRPLEEQPTVISKPSRTRDLMAARPTDLARGLEGTRLGHYQLEEFVGGGGMGAVFRALDLELSRTVAVKVVPCDKTDEETLKRFKNEAQSAARLDHARIARVFYVGVDKGWHYIVFEFVEGVNIRDLVEHKGPLSLEEALQYTRQVAEALDHAWRRDVVHRDVKPSNVLVMQDGTIKVVDMGLARLHQVESSSEDLTESGVTLGTFDYISPEQARDPRNADVRSDLYSLGCTLFYMLTGRPPFPEGTVLQKLLRHSSETPPRVSDIRGGLPESIVDVVDRLLCKLPGARYQIPAELIVSLDAVAKESGIPVEPTTVSLADADQLKREPAWRRHVGWVAPVLALVLIGLALDWSNRLAEAEPAVPQLQPAKRAAEPPNPAPSGDSSPAFSGRVDLEETALDSGGGATMGDEALGVGPPPESEEVSAEVAALDPHKIIVRGAGEPAVPGVAHVDSLQEAVRRLESSELKTIELQFNGDLDASPLTLAVKRPLKIQAAPGYHPRLRFSPEGIEQRQRRMFRLQGGYLTFSSVNMLLQLPETTAYEGWSLFHLTRDAHLDLMDCVLTVDGGGSRNDHQSSVFEFIGRSSADMPEMPKVGEQPSFDWQQSAVTLIRCVARGPTSLVRSEGAPFVCTWEDGLLAISGNVISARGASVESTKRRKMSTNLTNVTVYSEQGGLGLVTIDATARHLLELDFYITSCALSTSSNELITHIGVESTTEATQWVDWEALNNLIDPMLLRHKVTTSLQDMSTVPLSKSAAGVLEAPAWKQLGSLDDLQLSQRMPAQFELDYSTDGAKPGCPTMVLQELVDAEANATGEVP